MAPGGDNMPVDGAPKAGRREWIGLAVLGLPTMLLSLDLSVLFLAMPHLSADLGASSTEQLWITDIYGFATAGFMITMGTLGDRIGRRRLLLIGAASFGVVSVAAAYSTSPQALIATRTLLGVAGATLLPSTLALIRTMFHDPKQMGVAIAAWTTCYMAGVALGPVAGGLMLEHFWWGSVFLLAVPVMGLLLLAGPVLLHEHRDREAGRIDLASVALSLAAILLVTYGLKELGRYGYRPLFVLAVMGGAALGVAFVVRQRRLVHPLLDLGLFGIRTVRVMLVIAVSVAVVQNGNALVVTLYLQMVQGLSPLEAGLWLLLPSVALVTAVNATPRLVSRIRPGNLFAAGLVASAGGYLLIAQVGSIGELAVVIVGAVVVFAGIGPAGALVNQLILGAVPPDKAGSAASMASTSGELGIAMGIAVLGSLANLIYRSHVVVPATVPAEPAHTASESIVDAVTTAERLPDALGADLVDAARDAFTTAMGGLAATSAVLLLALAAFATAALRHLPHTRQGASTTAATDHPTTATTSVTGP
jgi:DHA2 family multidrug resistance protein-like MFS transporter